MQSLWIDLSLNLFAEGIGILITIFVIDLILKRREAKRWLPAKEYSHAHLMTELDKFLTQILGKAFEYDLKGPSVFYKFGNVSVLGEASYKNYDPINVISALNSRQNLYEGLQKEFDFEPLRNLSNNLKNIIITSSHLFSPELCSILIGLDSNISEYIQKLDSKDLDMNKFMNDFVLSTHRIVTMAIDARICVEQEADKVISVSEAMAKASKQIDKASKFFKERHSPK